MAFQLTPTSYANNRSKGGSQSSSPNHRLLFVEDDPSAQAKLTRMVGRIGRDWEVDCVTSGEEALRAIERMDSYDLILADYFLDGAMTGADFASKYAAKKWISVSSADFGDIRI